VNRLKRSSDDVVGRRILFKYKLWGNARAHFAKERGALNKAGSRGFDEGEQTMRYFYAPVELTGPEIEACKGKGAIIDLVADAIEDTAELAMHKSNVVAWGDGSGKIAQITNTVAPTYSGVTGLTAIYFDHGVPAHFLDHQTVQFISNATPPLISMLEWEVNSVDGDNSILYILGDCTGDPYCSNDCWIVNYGDADASYGMVAWGLAIHANTVNTPHALYQGIDRTLAGNEWAQGIVNDNSGTDRALTIDLMTQHFQNARRKANGTPLNTILTEDGVLNSFVMLLAANKVGIEPMPTEDGTAPKYKFVFQGQKIEIESHATAPLGSMWCFNDKMIVIGEMLPFGWDMNGGGKLKVDAQIDVMWGRMKWYYNYYVKKPRTMTVIKDIKRNSIV
jgi:hypothetical protein